MTELLLANGANVNLPDYGMYTPLHEAAIQVGYSTNDYYTFLTLIFFCLLERVISP